MNWAKAMGRFGAGCVLLCVSSLASGGARLDAEPGSLEWFQEIWDEATAWKPPTGVTIEYDIVERHTVEQSQIDELVLKGASDLTHPHHSQLVNLLQLQRVPEYPSKQVVTLLAEGWRVDRDCLAEGLTPEQKWETVAEGTSRWQLRPGSLLITDKSEPDEHFGFDNELAAIDLHLREHVWFGMGNQSGAAWRFRPESSKLASDGSWIGVVATPDRGIRKQFSGRIDSEGDVFVSRAEIIEARDEHAYAVGQSWEFAEPVAGGILGDRTIGRRVTWRLPPAGITRTQTLVSVSSIPSSETKNYALLDPPLNGQNALRGDVSVSQLREVARGRERRSVEDDAGGRRVVDADAGAWWRQSDSWSPKHLGWLVAGFMVILIVVVRVWTARRP
ncbi:MAG: hypothetical protein DYG94_06840 [Leptolyngbya sp. PLA3]|nr:MAG: hypothetical protein EDM82_06185 [Cyanobacteria bacterium CYA]MCE7968444.1 hypothetical protein [Leptolyngbya sp. PL-A3]